MNTKPESHVVFENLAKHGFGTEDFLRRLRSWLKSADTEILRHTTAFISIGLNDTFIEDELNFAKVVRTLAAHDFSDVYFLHPTTSSLIFSVHKERLVQKTAEMQKRVLLQLRQGKLHPKACGYHSIDMAELLREEEANEGNLVWNKHDNRFESPNFVWLDGYHLKPAGEDKLVKHLASHIGLVWR